MMKADVEIADNIVARFGAKRVDRTILSSGRVVPTLEFNDDPNNFHVPMGRHLSGPYPLDDPRFKTHAHANA